jgi:AraC-like DNA-binding protein
MTLLRRPPHPALAPYVDCLWHLDETSDETSAEAKPRAARERALPTGAMDLVFRLSEAPVRVFADANDREGRCFGRAVVIGARSSSYLRDTAQPSRSVGVHFRPGGATALLGVPADELAGRHTPLADLWAGSATSAHERIADARSADQRLRRFEALLLARLSAEGSPRPLVAHALARLAAPRPCSVEALARSSGVSHRHLIELFRRSAGLTPKVFARVRRFQRAVKLLARERSTRLAEVALACGYADQPHLTREFRAFAGCGPGRFAPLSPERPNHVAADAPCALRSRTCKPGAGEPR